MPPFGTRTSEMSTCGAGPAVSIAIAPSANRSDFRFIGSHPAYTAVLSPYPDRPFLDIGLRPRGHELRALHDDIGRGVPDWVRPRSDHIRAAGRTSAAS